MNTRPTVLKRLLLRGLLPAALLVPSPGFGQAVEPISVTGVRFWSLDGVTRIAVETSGDFLYRWDRLSDPDRLYFDILGARQRASGERIHATAVGDRLLKQIRLAQPQPDFTRIVLDLAAPVDFTSAQLANPNRLMIELRPAAAKVPAPAPAVLPAPAATSREPQTAASSPPGREREAAASSSAPLPGIPQPARRDQAGNRSMVRALGLKLARVVLDPGHGGHDTGTMSPSGLVEKELVLDIARRLGKLIEQRLGAEVVYTRSDDTFIPLEQRTAFANEKKADLFLSIHANSGARSAAGPETYYLNFSGSAAALEVAARENASSDKGIHELKDLLQKIALTDKLEESRDFATRVQSALSLTAARNNRDARDRGVRKAPFVVLIGAGMPSILAEIGFMSNSREERLLKRPAYRQKVAEALLKGLTDYASTLSHFQVAEKKTP